MSTSDDLKRVVQTTDEMADKLLRAYALEIFTRVVRRTPIDEGTARGNWNVAQGAPDDTVIPGGGSTEPPALIDAMEIGPTYYISNATPYIEVLEFGGYPNPPKRGTGKTIGGYSTQAPQGMVRVTAEELEPLRRQIVARIRGQQS